MPNKRIDQLNPNLNPLTGNELVPIFDSSSSTTERITLNELAAFVDNATDTFLTGATFNNTNDTLSLLMANGNNVDVTINRYNRWFVPSGQTLTTPSNFQSFIYGDLVVEGTLFLEDNSQLVILNGDIILSGGTIVGSGTTYIIDLPETDLHVTSGTFNPISKQITFTGNIGFVPFDVDLSTLSTDNFYLTAGTYNSITKSIDFSGNSVQTEFSVDVSQLLDDTNTYTTGATLNGDIIEFNRNDISNAYSVDLLPALSAFSTTDYYTTGATLNGNLLEFNRNDISNAYSVDLTPFKFTGNTLVDCITDIFVSNLHSCSPLRINPNDEGEVVFGSNSGVTIDVSTGKVSLTDLQITNGATDTYVLTSDPSGNASWQPPFNSNIYNSDGTLTGGRTINTNGNVLSLQSSVAGANVFNYYGSGNGPTSRTYFEMGQIKNGAFSTSVFFTTFSPDYNNSLWGSFFAGSAMLSSYHESPGTSQGTGNLYFDLSHYTGTLTNKYFAWHAAPVLTARGLNTEMMRLHVLSDGNGYLGIGTKGVPQERLHVSGNTRIDGNLIVNGNSVFSGTTTDVVKIYGSGTTTPIFSIQGSSGELFSVTDSLVGSLFSVNDISGLPVLEVFSDNTVLMGSYQAPSLNTTVRKTLSSGNNIVYSIPTSAYTGAFFDYTLISSTGARAGNVMAIWSGITSQYTDVSTNDIGDTTGVIFSVSVSGSSAIFSSSANTSGWTLKTIVRSI